MKRPFPGRGRTGRLAAAFAGFAMVGLAGCGNLTAGGFGEVMAEMVGDGGDAGQGGAASVIIPGAQLQSNGGGLFQGEVTVELQLFLREESGGWIEVTDGVQRVEVDAAGSVVAEFARRDLAQGGYDRLRVEFLSVEALVTSAPPGLGVPEGLVVVDFGGDPVVVVERPLIVQVGPDGQRLRVNLRAGAWLRFAVMGRVPGASFRSAVQLSVVGSGP
jgi:hypothetical protein